MANVEGLTPKPGVERWATKTGTDRLSASVAMMPQRVDIATLISFSAPADPDAVPDRITPVEMTIFTVSATLTGYKEEQDGDYHLVLQDANGRTMIAEIPDPDFCAGSAWLDQITAARAAFDAKFSASLAALKGLRETLQGSGVPMITKVSTPVTVTGVGFFDRLHGQTGVAPNGIELHPVLDIAFSLPS